MRKSFHILDGLKIGGIENLAFTLASAEKKLNSEHYLINLNINLNEYSDNFFFQNKYSNLKIISFKKKRGLSLLFFIFKFLKKEKPSNLIIYFNNITTLWVMIGAKLSATNNIAICIQNTVSKLSIKSLKSIFLMRIFNLFQAKLVPCSKAIVDSYWEIDKNIKFADVIPNCINVKYFKDELNKLKNKSQIKSKNKKTIVMIARLDEIKDQETLIKAYSKIKNNCNLYLIGSGKKRLYLEQKAHKVGLDPSNIFLGPRLNIPEILASADIFAFSTSSSEGFGIALIEAMAAELPIIASDVPACREVLNNGKAGIMVPVKDVNTWIKVLNQMLESKELRDFYRSQSIVNLRNYDVDLVINNWENLFG